MGVATHFSHPHYVANYDIAGTIALAAELEVGWLRDELFWRFYETEKGRYELPERTRQWIDAANAAGLKIILCFNYGNKVYADPYDPEAYAKAAAHLARELKGKVQVIEILNEPNNFGFRQLYGGAWNGVPENGKPAAYVVKYTELLNKAAVAIKAANPEMKVIGCGAPAPANYRMISLGITPAVDGITDHPYSAFTVPEIVPFASTPGILERDQIATADKQGSFTSFISMYREHSAKHKGPKEIWLTEWGFATHQSDPAKSGGFAGFTEEAQAKYTLRRFAEGLGLGVEASIYYALKSDGTNPTDPEHNFGLVGHGKDPRRKLSFEAVRRFARFTDPYRVASQPPTVDTFEADTRPDPWPITWDGSVLSAPGTIRTYAFERASGPDAGEQMLLVWSAERVGGDAKPRLADFEVTWPQTMPVKKVRAHDLWADTCQDVNFEMKPDGRLILPKLTVPAHPVALIFTRQ